MIRLDLALITSDFGATDPKHTCKTAAPNKLALIPVLDFKDGYLTENNRGLASPVELQ